MHPFDRPTRPQPLGRTSAGDLDRFSDPATLVCAALMLALIVLSVRIVGIW